MTGRNESSRLPGAGVPSAGEAPIPVRAGAETPAPPGRARSWRLEMPDGQQLLNSNQRLHWSKERQITRQLRSDAFYVAKYARIPRLERIRIDAYYCPPDARRRDAGNWYPTYKAQIDGLVDAGVIADDDHTRLEGPFPHIGPVRPGGRIVLIVTELEPTPGATS